MKNLFKSAAAIIVSLFSVQNNNAQETKLENSLLWEISGKGLEKPSYLFGTIHMICESDFVIKEKVEKALAKSDKVAFEVNVTDKNEEAMMQSAAIGEKPLSKTLNDEQLKTLDKILRDNFKLSVAQVDQYSLNTISSLLAIKAFGCKNPKFFEKELVTKSNGKTVVGLEKGIEQANILKSAFTMEELMKSINEFNPKETQNLVDAYNNEDLNAIDNIIHDPKTSSENSMKIILDNRNENWLTKMPNLMKNESVFFAVGSGHLPGKMGVINLLKQAGYTVTPILN
jgi:uncharacterized protein